MLSKSGKASFRAIYTQHIPETNLGTISHLKYGMARELSSTPHNILP
jgi:hypothetical protein